MKNIVLSVAGAILILSAAPQFGEASFLLTSAQKQADPQMKTFSGTIVKSGDNFVLSDSANKISYMLDDAKKASQFEGKRVKVTGTMDVATNTIHVDTIQEVA